MSQFVTFTDNNFETQAAAASHEKPVLVDVWAPWCGPCRLVGPTIEQVAKTLDGKAVVGKLDADDNPETVQRFGIRSLPTVLVFRDGKVVGSLVGVRSEEDYVAAYTDALADSVV